MKISIVINTLNRAQDLERALLSLRYLDYPDFEVIVVNGPSTDNTAEILEQYKDMIKIGICPVNNISVSRNIGIAMSSGKYVAFMDDDAVPEPNWLSNLIKGFEADDVAAVGSDVYNPTGKEYQIRKLICSRWGGTSDTAFDFPHSMQFTAVMGTNCIFDKEKLLEVGGYNEQYDYFLDETDVCARLVDAGYRVNYIPNACIHHKFSPSAQRNTSKVVTDWTKIVKNTVYFSRTYLSYLGDDVVAQHIKNVAKDRKAESLAAMHSYKLTRADYERACASVDEGIEQGEKDFQRGYHLFITKDTLEKYKSPFKRFPTYFEKLKKDKLTIVYLTDDFLPEIKGGVGRFISALAGVVAKEGHNVHVITLSSSDYDTVDFEEGIWVHRITVKNYPDHLLNKLSFYTTYFDHWKLCKLYSYYQELLEINFKNKVNIVHSSIWDCLNYYSLLDERFINITTLVTPFNNVYGKTYPMPNEYKFAIDMEREVLECSKYLHADSKAIISEINSYYPRVCNNKTSVIYLGLPDLCNISLNDKVNDNCEILFVGRLEYRKGIDVLFACIPEICKKYQNVTFRFIGNDQIKIPSSNITYKEQFFENCKDENFIDRVIFEGFASDERIKEAYANCDIFVSPSRYESFGLIFIEAMMFSKPVIGCDVGAMPELISHGENGLLAIPGDKISLKENLEKLIKNEKIRKIMGTKGRKRYETSFADKIMGQKLIAYYLDIWRKEQGEN